MLHRGMRGRQRQSHGTATPEPSPHPLLHLRRQAVPVRRCHLDQPNVVAALRLLDQPCPPKDYGRHQRDRPVEQPTHHRHERGAEQLHPADLVDHEQVHLARVPAQLGLDQRCQGSRLDAVAADAVAGPGADVGEEGVRAGGEAHGLEADAAAALADLLGVEAGQAEVGQAFDKVEDRGGLVPGRRTGEQEVRLELGRTGS
jgi:hypothetical protein